MSAVINHSERTIRKAIEVARLRDDEHKSFGAIGAEMGITKSAAFKLYRQVASAESCLQHEYEKQAWMAEQMERLICAIDEVLPPAVQEDLGLHPRPTPRTVLDAIERGVNTRSALTDPSIWGAAHPTHTEDRVLDILADLSAGRQITISRDKEGEPVYRLKGA